jgi:membrane-bound serine protease (ClpP class)
VVAEIPAERAEVACYVSGNALGDAALIPLGCDTILMQANAKLGGSGEATITPTTCKDYKDSIQLLAKTAGRSDGELLCLICPEMQVFEYSSFDGRRQLETPGWLIDDPVVPQWVQGEKKSYPNGLSFDKANQLGLASDTLASIEAVGNRYGIEQLPEEIRTNSTEQFVEWLAGQGWFSMLLFFVGIICLSAELSTPGVGIAGILSAVCFLLFFWINIFQGTVEWLEILLVLAGVVCLVIELFVFPGFGVFGVTGIVLLAIGLLLAGQTFVLPTNDYQWQRTVQGLGQMGLVFFGLVATAIVFRKQLANLPMVRWFALQPPAEDRELVAKERAEESLRTFIGWHGTTISRCNPSGKASIGDRVFSVVSRDTWIDEDTEIEVVGMQGNTLIIQTRAKLGASG